MTKNQANRRQARPAVADLGRKVTPLQAQVLLAARRRCDDMGDSQAARDQMKRDVLETPAELLADLLTAISSVHITRAEFLSLPTTQKECNP